MIFIILIVSQTVLSFECPKNVSGWRQRGVVLSCTGVTLYHCLRDEVGDARESCLEKTWVQPGFCPEFNSVAKKMDVSICQVSRGKCPTRTYWSNEVYMYSACLSVKLTTDVSVTAKPTSSDYVMIGIAPQSSTTKETVSPDKNANGANEKVGSVTTVIITIVTTILILLVLCSIAVFVYRRRFKRHSTPNLDREDEPDPCTKLVNTQLTDEVKVGTEEEVKMIEHRYYAKDKEKSEVLTPASIQTSDGKKVSSDGKFEYSERFESVGKVVEKAGPLLKKNGILVLICPSKKLMTEVAQSVALTCDTQEYPSGFKKFNDSFVEMDKSNKETKCVVFKDCFHIGGQTIKFMEHKSIFNDLHKKQEASGGRLRLVITVPLILWNARRRTLSASNLFLDRYILKFSDIDAQNMQKLPV